MNILELKKMYHHVKKEVNPKENKSSVKKIKNLFLNWGLDRQLHQETQLGKRLIWQTDTWTLKGKAKIVS